MAEIELRDSETEQGAMPEVCNACGRPARAHVRKTFSWNPPWIILTVLIAWPITVILMLALSKRMAVEAPVCDRHKGYWWKRQLLIWLPLLVFATAAVAGGVLAAKEPEGGNKLPGFVCFGSAVIGFGWLLTAAVIQSLMIRPKEITDGSITLKNVHEDFVEAFRAKRKQRRTEFDPLYAEGVTDYDEKLRRRREHRADRRTGHTEPPPDSADAYRIKPDD